MNTSGRRRDTSEYFDNMFFYCTTVTTDRFYCGKDLYKLLQQSMQCMNRARCDDWQQMATNKNVKKKDPI